MDPSDTINALAALGLFLSAGAGAIGGHVAAKRSGKESTQTADGADRRADQTEARAELVGTPALELRIRQVARGDEDVEWVLTCRADPEIAP